MALSKIPDLTYSYKGQDYTFVKQLEVCLKELECPICHSIVSEPLQTSCGHLFCKECHSKLGRTQCPVCKQEHNTMPDKFNDRRVKILQVRCTNYQYGCKWVGNLDDELQHRMTPNSCHCEKIPCTHGCGQTIRRTTQTCHLNECQMRPHKCEHCGEEGPYWKIVHGHQKRCRRYPVWCPNGCNEQIPREDTASYKLKKAVSSLESKLQAEEQRARGLEEELSQVASDAKAKTRHIRQLESDTKAKTKHICDLQRDTKANKERISQLESAIKVKTEHIHDLKKVSRTQAQQIAQLTTENSEKEKKLKHIEFFLVFAWGIILLFNLHTLYVIPIFILYIAASA